MKRGECPTCSTSLRKVMTLKYWSIQSVAFQLYHAKEPHLSFWGAQM